MSNSPPSRWRRVGTTALAVAVAIPALFACGGSDGGTCSEKTLEFWSQWKEGDPQQKILQDAISAFQTKTSVTVKVQSQGREVGKKVRAGANLGRVPDLTDDASETFWSAYQTGPGLGPADIYSMELGDEDGGRSVGDAVPADTVSAYNTPDGPVLVPYMALTTALWFNWRALPDVAATPPTTVDQFIAVLDRGGLFAGVCIVVLPMVLLYLVLSRRIIEGMTVGASK